MRKFKSKKEQLEWADNLLRKLANPNTGGVTPTIKKMIAENYIRRSKK
jgi:citrate lyase beta subunit|tara:strand:+ start:247 stop:390 length:144 start_codon:yes stop_codon:yes gene_type:complete